MTKDEIIRLPVIVNVFQKLYPSHGTCNVCGLPWGVCGHEDIDITEEYGVFYICPYCFRTTYLKKILEATAKGYLEQYNTLQGTNEICDFLKTHNLEKILELTQEKYIKIHENNSK